MSGPLLELRGVRREYPSGDQPVVALSDVDLVIEAGEMVAIVGASGSGKSTLMNILGCLDRPTAGSYRVSGRETGALAPDQLAALRREHFGFVFQRYHLLPDLSARGNVEIPAIYAGHGRQARARRAEALLAELGLADRAGHRPSQLSGGQQQRVSIARALMNGGDVVLADEPTGALDRQTGEQMLGILKTLHAAGHTVIIVTHDREVAAHAQRIIELSDGAIVADRRQSAERADHQPRFAPPASGWRGRLDRLADAFRMALLAMNAHRLRTFLTMLGIIIGIASVVSVVALGEGSRQRVLKDISAMGTNTLDIYPGADFGDMRSGAVRTLIPADAETLAGQDYVDSVTPGVSSSVVLRYGNVAANAQVSGVGEQFFRVRGMTITAGAAFDQGAIRRLAQEVVIDANTRKKFFGTREDPIGRVILVGAMPCRVIGVAERKQSGFTDTENLNVWAPYSTVMGRLLGQFYLKSMTVRVADHAPMASAKAAVTRLLSLRHGRKDFYVSDTDTIRKTIEKTTATMALLITMIAVISLVVGGIGVMNITLVSVTERTQEIGVRMAVGARQADILQQFLIEAVLVCLLGGAIGVLLAYAVGAAFSALGGSFPMVFSAASILAAFACSTLIGIAFGFLPARHAARLDPVEALARE